MTSLDTLDVHAVTEELAALFGDEEPNTEDLAAFVGAHPELGFTLRPSYQEERGIMLDAVVLAATGLLDSYTVIVAGGLFGPFGAEWDTAIGEDAAEIARRLVETSERALGLRGQHLVVQR